MPDEMRGFPPFPQKDVQSHDILYRLLSGHPLQVMILPWGCLDVLEAGEFAGSASGVCDSSQPRGVLE
jgi:hypothetical protein